MKVRDRREANDSYMVYAIVKFNDASAAQEALDRKTLDMKRKTVRIEKYSEDKQYHIYIKNIKNLTEDQIRKHFGQYGKVDGLHKYFADEHYTCLLRFEKAEEAEKCLKHTEQSVEGIKLWIGRYISKDLRHEEFYRLYLARIPATVDSKEEI